MQKHKMTRELKKLTSAIKVWHLACAGMLVGQVFSPMAFAGPKGGVITGGEGGITVDDLATIINQETDLLSIDWESFNISEEELVKFLQPDSSSVVLNRILDSNASEIRGKIESNGHVILANPRGVLFTETSTVNVGAITAAGLDMDPQDFMSGNFAFKGEGGTSGIVVNRGVINAASAVLVGKQITNAPGSLISAEMVSLAAADEAVLTFDADGLIGVQVTKEVMENQMGVDSAVLNQGQIDGTKVLMEASVSGDLFTSAVNNEGVVRARGIDTSGGVIRLTGSGASAVNSGALDASGSTGGQVVIEGDSAIHSGRIAALGNNGQGGRVEVLGDEVTVSGAIDARGTAGGGEVLIGGDYQGKNEQVRNAETSVVTAEADIDASGIGGSDGGKVIVWADDTTRFAGTIRAESGELGGDGGFVETSGKVNLDLGEDTMSVSTLSFVNGETGEWLLDPSWLEITNLPGGSSCTNCVTVSSLQAALANNNVTIAVDDAKTASTTGGDLFEDTTPDYTDGILVESNLEWSSEYTLTLNSFSGIQVGNGVSIDAENGGLSMTAGGSFVNNGTVNVKNVSLSVGQKGSGSENLLGNFGNNIVAGSITGGAGSDTFTLLDSGNQILVNADGSFRLNDLLGFSNIEVVGAGAGENSIDASLYDAGLSLTGTANQVKAGSISFNGIDTAEAQTLTGSSGNDNFIVSSAENNSLSAASIVFSGVSAVNAGGDAENTEGDVVQARGDMELTGALGGLVNKSITFNGIEAVHGNGGSLIGSAQVDEFAVNFDTVTANGIVFDGFTGEIDGKGQGTNESDKVTGYDGKDWIVIDDARASNNDIIFVNVEQLSTSSADLLGRDGAEGHDNFVLTASGDVSVGSMTFDNMNAVRGRGGDNDLDATAYTAGLELNGSDNQVELVHDSLTRIFYDIDTAQTQILTGSSGNDNFIVSSAENNSLSAASIVFSGVSAVNAGGDAENTEGDVVQARGDMELTGALGGLVNKSITFNGIEAVHGNGGSLIGSAQVDEFAVNFDTVTANGIVFDGFTGEIDGKGQGTNESDKVTGYDGKDWIVIDDARASNNDIIFVNVEQLSTSSADLLGRDGTEGHDNFVLTASGDVSVGSMTFDNMNAVRGRGGDNDLDATAYTAGLELNGSDNQVELVHDSLTRIFYDIDTAQTQILTGSSGNDNFIVSSAENNSLSAASIVFSGVSAVNAGGDAENTEGDVVQARGDMELTGALGGLVNKSITFNGIEAVHGNGGSLIGSAQVDEFAVNFDTVTANGIVFDGFTGEIDGKGQGTNESDKVTGYDGKDWIVIDDARASNNDIIFVNVEQLSTSSADLLGRDGAEGHDNFVLTASGDVSVGSMTFDNMNAVRGRGGDNDLDATAYTAGLELNGSDNQVELVHDSLTRIFYDIDTAQTQILTGSSGNDNFIVSSAENNSLSAASIVFSGVSAVNAGGDAENTEGDVVQARGDMELTGALGGLVNKSITFNGIEAVHGNGGSLIGSAQVDEFAVNFDTVTANGIVFDGFTGEIDGKGQGTNESDKVTGYDGKDWIVIDDARASNNDIIFVNVEQLSTSSADLLGRDGTEGHDNFVLTASGDVSVGSMTFDNMNAVRGRGGDNDLDATAYTAGLELNGSDNQVELVHDSLTRIFYDIDTAQTQILTGSSGNDNFIVSSAENNSLSAASIVFSGVSAVNAGGDAENTEGDVVQARGDMELTGALGGLVNKSITFNGIEAVHGNGGSLIGSAQVDEFAVNFDTVTANGIVFDGFTGEIDGKGQGTNESDKVTGYDGKDWIVIDDARASNNDIIFVNVEQLSTSSADLLGRDGAEGHDNFVLTASGDVSVGSMTFDNMNAVRGRGGDNDLDATAYTAGLELNGSDNQVELVHDSLIRAFHNIDTVDVDELYGTNGDETFDMLGDNSFSVAGMTFGSVTYVDAKEPINGDVLNAIDGVTIEDDLKITGGVTFENIGNTYAEVVELNNSSNNIEILEFGAILWDGEADGIYGVKEVYAKNGNDAVTGLKGEDWVLLGDKSAKSSGITFYSIETIFSDNSGLLGSAADETFSLTTEGFVDVNDMIFQGLDSVDGGGGSDMLDSRLYQQALSLTGNLNEVRSVPLNITFSGMEEVEVTSIFGTSRNDELGISGNDEFEILGDNRLISYGIEFTGVNTVDAGGNSIDGADNVKAIASMDLTGTDGEMTTSYITFSNIETASGTTLVGSDKADNFTVTGVTEVDAATAVVSVTANGIQFSGLSGEVDTGLESDTVTGLSGKDWNVQGDSKAENSGLVFANAELHIARGADLNGTASDDQFTLEADGDIKAGSMTFRGMNAVRGKGGSDTLNAMAYEAGLALTGTNNLLSAKPLNMLFHGISIADVTNLTGTNGDDLFEFSDDGFFTAKNVTFRNVEVVEAGTNTAAGSDTVVTRGAATLTGTAGELLTDNVLFRGVESAKSVTNLFGSEASDVFAVKVDNTDSTNIFNVVDAAGINFTGVTNVFAASETATSSGDDVVTTTLSEGWSLTENSDQVTHDTITFNGIREFKGGNGVLTGHAGGDSYTAKGDNSVSVDNMTFNGLSEVNAATGTDSLTGIGEATLSEQQIGDFYTTSMSFSGFESLEASSLVATSKAESFWFDSDGALSIDGYNLKVSGLKSLNAGAGSDSIKVRDEDDVTLNGSNAITTNTIEVTNIEKVTNTGDLNGTSNKDEFVALSAKTLSSYGIRFENVDKVIASGGIDELQGLDNAWTLTGTDNALEHAGVNYAGLEKTTGGNGTLNGSASADEFTIGADEQVTANQITFTGITTVRADGGNDRVISAGGETWILGAIEGDAKVGSISFSSIESVLADNVQVDAATNNDNDNFELGDSDQSLLVRGIDFSSVSSVLAGIDDSDQVISNASSWQLTGTDGEVAANGVDFTGIDTVNVISGNAQLAASGGDDIFALSGENTLSTAAIEFKGVSSVAGGGGADLLRGTEADENYGLAANGDISVAGIRFSGLKSVNTAGGADTIDASGAGASWTSVESGGSLEEGSAVATVNSLEVAFENLEQIIGAGAYTGLNIDSDYLFDSLTSTTIGGIAFTGLTSITAGSGTDVFRATGLDVDAIWELDGSGGLVSSGGSSLIFNGFESIFAGGGADQFTLSGGELTSLDTGAGNDSVLLTGTTISSLSLGNGNDLLQVDADSNQRVAIDGGEGEDEFQLQIDGKTWRIFGSDDTGMQLACAACTMTGGTSGDYDFSVGNFHFGAFEWLENAGDNLAVETDQAFDFFQGDSAGMHFTGSDMRMGYNGGGDVNIVSTGTQTIGGDAQAERMDLVVAGDVDITSDIGVLNVQATDDVDITVVADVDLVIDEINAGRNGTIILDSGRFGNLTGESYGDTHLTARTVQLGSDLQQWSVIGSAINPLRMDVTESVDIVSITYFEPDFINQIPTLTAKGDELQSIAGAQAAQGLKSAVQNGVEDFTQVDPGIFTAVPPYSAGVEVVNAPEMSLSVNGLQPVHAPANDEDEEDTEERMREELPPAEDATGSGSRSR